MGESRVTAQLYPVRSIVPPIRSAADVGYGVGTWLAVLLESGCEDVVSSPAPSRIDPASTRIFHIAR